MEKHLGYRKSIIELLKSIAALDPMEGPTEMICGWYDDLYLPCHDPKGFHKDVWEQGQREWFQCFSKQEVEALANFHSVFESVVDELPENPVRVSSDSNWRKLSQAAKQALEAFRSGDA